MANYVALNSLAKGQLADSSGNVQVSRQVNVYLRGTTTPVTVFPNSNGTGSPLGQPLTTDSNGDVPGYVQSATPIDFVDVLSGARNQGEPISASDVPIPLPHPQLVETHGHSLYDGGAIPSDLNGWHERLYAILGSAKRNIRAVGGAIAAWHEQTVGANQVPQLGSGGWARVLQRQQRIEETTFSGSYLPACSIFLAHYGLNDLARMGGNTPTPWITAMRTILSRGISAAVFEAETSSAWTFPSGTWATSSPSTNINSGTGIKYISTGTSGTAQFTIPSDMPTGRIVGIGIYCPGATATCTVTISVSGTTRFTLNLNAAQLTDQNTAVWQTGPLPNEHTIRIGTGAVGDAALTGGQTISVAFSSIAGLSGSMVWGVDCAQIETDPLDGPILLVPNVNRPSNYSIYAGDLTMWPHGPGAATDPITDSSVAQYNTALTALLTEFTARPLVSTDCDTLFGGQAKYFYTDGAHLSDLGHAVMAQQVYQDLINSKLFNPRIAAAANIPGNTEWTYLALNNSWVPYNAFGYDAPMFRRDENDNVFLKGAVKNGTSTGAIIGTLPVGYRPKASRGFPIATAGGISYATVANNGTIQNTGSAGSTGFTTLDGISFPAEA